MSPRGVHREKKFTGTLPVEEDKLEPLFGHCGRKKCAESRKGEACNCRPCVNCDPKNAALLEASVLEHCGSVLCMARLRPETRAVYPSCACSCSKCAHIANVAGVARCDGTRGSAPAHCESPLCKQRLDPKNQVPAPACPCGCWPCDEIAVACGLRPASAHLRPTADAPPAAVDEDDFSLEGVVLEEELPIPEDSEPELPIPEDSEPELPLPPDDEDVSLAGIAFEGEPASPSNRLGAAVGRALPSAPIVTGSKCSLLRECVYWTRDDVERQADETSEDALYGTVGHTYAEEYARGTVTAAREDELVSMVPSTKRDKLRMCMVHIARWLDTHRRGIRRAEVPVAWDPDAGELGRGVELGPTLKEMFVEGARSYTDARVWTELRRRLELGPRSIPATVDLQNFVEGELVLYDWCLGRTDKRRQLALGMLAMVSIFQVHSACAFGLYVDEEGVREARYDFDRESLLEQADEFRALLTAAPSAAPTPGMHCLHDHCSARASCPVTAQSTAMVLDPEAESDIRVVPGVAGACDVTHAFKFSPTVRGRAHAQWLLPRARLVRDAAEKVIDALERWTVMQPEPYIETSPGKCWGEVPQKGRESFAQKHALDLLRTLGATDEQIAGCYRQGPASKSFREKNLPSASR